MNFPLGWSSNSGLHTYAGGSPHDDHPRGVMLSPRGAGRGLALPARGSMPPLPRCRHSINFPHV
eukprot:14333748-Alexandrium_andersonii.AAC.1